jgi:hypothetical protein
MHVRSPFGQCGLLCFGFDVGVVLCILQSTMLMLGSCDYRVPRFEFHHFLVIGVKRNLPRNALTSVLDGRQSLLLLVHVLEFMYSGNMAPKSSSSTRAF